MSEAMPDEAEGSKTIRRRVLTEGKMMKILFVENHSTFAGIVTAQFLQGHQVTVIPNMADARKSLSGGEFDVVLVDYDLDDGEGDQLVADIRNKGIPVKVVAVSSHEHGNSALMAAGADAACSKMEFKHIGQTLDSLFKTKAK